MYIPPKEKKKKYNREEEEEAQIILLDYYITIRMIKTKKVTKCNMDTYLE